MSSWENIYASYSNYDNDQVEEQDTVTAEEKDETLKNQEDSQSEGEQDQDVEEAQAVDNQEEDQANEEAKEDYDVGWYDPPEQEEAPVPRDTNGHCNLCEKDFDNLSVVIKHQKSHRREKDKCPLCQRKFRSKSTLIMHTDNQHNRRLR